MAEAGSEGGDSARGEATTDIDRLEGVGALNFLALDDLVVTQEGELLDPLPWKEIPGAK